MGIWGAGPFDNDDAADFASELDDASAQARIQMVGAALERVADPTDDDSRLSDAARAVAAAALVAAQCAGGVPVDLIYGPSTPMPQFPACLRDLAIKALDSVISKPTWLAEAWSESPSGPEWRRIISDLRTILDPPQEETLLTF